jgi:hypothetical protein
MSESLKRLTAVDCEFDAGDARTHISTPNLIFLKFDEAWFRTPLFECMPFLEDAYMRFGNACWDHCQYDKSWPCGNVNCYGCSCNNDNKEVSLVLEGLSNATHLELINELPHLVCFHFTAILNTSIVLFPLQTKGRWICKFQNLYLFTH